MFGKRAKMLRESNSHRINSRADVEKYFEDNFDVSPEYYSSHRRGGGVYNYNYHFGNGDYTLSKIKKVFFDSVEGLNQSKNTVYFSFNVYLGGTTKENLSKAKSIINDRLSNRSNLRTVLPLETNASTPKKTRTEFSTSTLQSKNTIQYSVHSSKTDVPSNLKPRPILSVEPVDNFSCNPSLQNYFLYYLKNYLDKVIHVQQCLNFTLINSKPKKLPFLVQTASNVNLPKLENSKIALITNELNEKTTKNQSIKLQLNSITLKNQNLIKEINGFSTKINLLEALRKKAQEFIHSLKGNIRVYCRIKPTDNKKLILTLPLVSNINTTITTLELKNPNTNQTPQLFNFDRIFPQEATQEIIFGEVQQFIQSALDGESICIFAYGATGSGKTFTMQGSSSSPGILPRCAQFIFNEKKRLISHNQELVISLSAMEIYNEIPYDLLNNANKKGTRTPLTIYCANNEVNIPSLKWVDIENDSDIIKYTNIASESRRCDSTKFNATSSRSHAIFQIKITNKYTGKSSMINIIDLAGSERSQMTSFGKMNKEEIENMKKIQNEANFINKSLSALGRIINLIGDKKNTNKISIPYRESKLTMILQNYLKPEAKTVMIVNVACEEKNYNYTKESLNFATNAMVNC